MRRLNISKMIYLLSHNENLMLMGNNNGVDVVSLPVNQGSLNFKYRSKFEFKCKYTKL
jgi:hypothetical protein